MPAAAAMADSEVNGDGDGKPAPGVADPPASGKFPSGLEVVMMVGGASVLEVVVAFGADELSGG